MEECEQQRVPPTHPEDMKHELETVKVFTGKGDLPVVAGMYRSLFELVAPTIKEADYRGLGWGALEGGKLAKSLPSMGSLTEVHHFLLRTNSATSTFSPIS